MTSLQMTGIGPSIASNGGAQAVAPPATGGRSAPAAPGNRGWPSAGTDQTYGSGPTDLAVAPGGKAAAQHAPPGAGETSEAIGTQLILVFDDQT
ncbi:MAG TPA: hypothetical protein VEE84_04940, partial [Burkholderiaceae bacterium]|nr:hypothetical protein [Burkholderiaceae bacterium]